MNNRKRGDYFERQTRDALTEYGWYVVRSAGSLGVADLVAGRAGNTTLLVSCKLGGRIDPHERNALMDVADATGWRPVVALRPRNGRVLIAAVHRGMSRLVPIDTLRVPARPRKAPAWEANRPEPDLLPIEPLAGRDAASREVPDGLLPLGVQLTIPDP